MDAILNSVLTIEWWLGVVAVGIALNLVSAYLKPWLDRRVSSVSKRWGERSRQRREQRAQLVMYLRDHPDEQLHVLADEMRCRFGTILHLVIAMALLVIAFADIPEWSRRPLFWFSLLIAFVGLTEHGSAMKYRSLVNEARNSGKAEGL